MVEQIEWGPLALSLDNLEIDSEEVTYHIATNVFSSVEMALSVIVVMGDTINNERQSLSLEHGECFRYWWQEPCTSTLVTSPHITAGATYT